MIRLEHVVLASPEQMKFIIEGMRNPYNSWENIDSYIYWSKPHDTKIDEQGFELGDNDLNLMQRLAKAGTDHRKFMRMMPVYVRITAPLYWWKEFDTYKVGSVANSCSTMHKIQEKEFTLEDFSCEHLINSPLIESEPGVPELLNMQAKHMLEIIIGVLNAARYNYLKTKDKKYWWQMIQLLPSSYNQTRNVMLNYEVLANIYKSRKNHKLDEWIEFCKWIESLPYSELITGKKGISSDEEFKAKIDKAIEDYGKTDEVNDIIDKLCAIGNPNPMTKEDLERVIHSDSGRGNGLWQPGDEF